MIRLLPIAFIASCAVPLPPPPPALTAPQVNAYPVSSAVCPLQPTAYWTSTTTYGVIQCCADTTDPTGNSLLCWPIP
jgi:hypothetical protein